MKASWMVAGLAALLFHFQGYGQSADLGDTLVYKIVPSPWSISTGFSLLTGMAGGGDPEVTYAGQADLGIHYQLNDKWMVGLQSSYTRYPVGVEPIRYGVRVQRNFNVFNNKTLYCAATLGSQRSLEFDWWRGTVWMEGEKPRAFGHIQTGFQWELPWIWMYIRTGLGYQIQHIYREVEDPWGDWSNEYRFRRMTWDTVLAFRLNKVYKS
ncbi:MAG TPA: hypothetical protein DCE41_37045 [Cytophagales bacterium]|nr:hypothetical protein [Cytophagales bacterium]HAA21179.1 hypothetical protein [Cytophagales bacterium]HAP60699.1 hypothetical protein [Cytophagales bacterium]